MNEATELGPRLRAERERQGISVQKAADAMRLDGWIIEALEAGQFGRIGPAVYAKGHLKKYASLLGLLPEEIAAAYEALTRQSAEPTAPTAPETPMMLRTTPVAAAEQRWRPLGAIAMLTAVIGGLLWWKAWGVHARRSRIVAALAVAVPAALPGASLPAAAQTHTVAAAPAEPPPAGTGAAGSTRLQLSFSADSWVDVRDVHGKHLYYGTARADTVESVDGEAPLRVVLGFVAGAHVAIDGRVVPVPPSFVDGNVARFGVGADGALEGVRGKATRPGSR